MERHIWICYECGFEKPFRALETAAEFNEEPECPECGEIMESEAVACWNKAEEGENW